MTIHASTNGCANTVRLLPNSRRLEDRLLEAFDGAAGRLRRSARRLCRYDGAWWLPVSGAAEFAVVGQAAGERATPAGVAFPVPATGDDQRVLHITGMENRISYHCRPGHSYRATIRKGVQAASEVSLSAAGDRPLPGGESLALASKKSSPHGPRRRSVPGDSSRPRRDDAACGSSSRSKWPAARPWRPIRSASFGSDRRRRRGNGAWLLGDGELRQRRRDQHRRRERRFQREAWMPLYTAGGQEFAAGEKLLRNMSRRGRNHSASR